MENDVRERVAYLKGLSEGLGIDRESKEGRVILEMVDILRDIAAGLASIEDRQIEMEGRVDSIDEDLAALEEDMCEDEYDYVEIECPHCKETVCFDEELLDEESELCCPSCGEVIFSAEHNAESGDESPAE